MNLSRLSILALLPALAASALLWAIVKRTNGDLLSFEGFEGLHLER